jgi:hypothetical protein
VCDCSNSTPPSPILTDRGQPYFATACAIGRWLSRYRLCVPWLQHSHSKQDVTRHTQLHRQDTETACLCSLTSGLHPPNRQEGSLGRDAEQFPVHMRLEGQLLMPGARCARSTSTSRAVPSCHPQTCAQLTSGNLSIVHFVHQPDGGQSDPAIVGAILPTRQGLRRVAWPRRLQLCTILSAASKTRT